MSAPPGFNPNASLLPDPGPSAAPIQVMKGGGAKRAQKGGVFTADQEAQLAKYQLHTGGVIADKFNEAQKEEFLKQVSNTSRCRRTTGDSVILGKDCDMVVKVIRELLNAKIKKGNLQVPVPSAPAPGAPAASTTTGEPAAPSGEPAPAEPAAPEPGDANSNLGDENVEGLHEFGDENLPTPAAPAAPNSPPGPKENVGNVEPPVSNNNRRRLESFLEENGNGNTNTVEKPSPCKNRGKTHRNGNAGSVGSVNEEERAAANAAAATGTAARRGGGKKTRKNRKSKK